MSFHLMAVNGSRNIGGSLRALFVNQEQHDNKVVGDAVGGVIADTIDEALLVPESGDMMRGEKDTKWLNVFVNSLEFTSNDASPVPQRREPPFFRE